MIPSDSSSTEGSGNARQRKIIAMPESNTVSMGTEHAVAMWGGAEAERASREYLSCDGFSRSRSLARLVGICDP